MNKTKPCQSCNGTGKQLDQAAIGDELRALRRAAGKSLRDIASALDISAPYLSDLERGNRNWSANRIQQFKKAVA